MTILTRFQEYEPVTEEQRNLQESLNVRFIKSAEGVDWYEAQSMLSADKLKILFDNNTGVIVGVGKDVYSMWPNGYSIADTALDVSVKPEELYGKVFDIDSGKIIDRVYSKEELAEAAQRKIKGLQSKTIALMTPLQSAKDLDMLTSEEAEHLDNLKRYLVHLSRIPKQEGYPESIEWPEMPEA